MHIGAYDFTRFTPLGHRRLFRWFDELASGMQGGPIYSGIHVLRSLFLVLSDRSRPRAALRLAALLITHPLRHLAVSGFLKSRNQRALQQLRVVILHRRFQQEYQRSFHAVE